MSLVRKIGGEKLGGMYGTAGATAPENAATPEWEAAYIAEYGELPVLSYVKETYDAVIALAFAAQACRQRRRHRRSATICGSLPDQLARPFWAHPPGVADGLALLAQGQEVNYDGASGTLDWDDNGDLRRGHIGTWRFTSDERIEELDSVYYEEPALIRPAVRPRCVQGYARTGKFDRDHVAGALFALNHRPQQPSVVCRRTCGWRSAGVATRC